MSGAEGLPAAVVAQAFADACPSDRKMDGTRRKVISTRGVKLNGAQARAEAWWFLTDTTGPWARARAEWCWAAGVDPEIVRRHALACGPSEATAGELAAIATAQRAAQARQGEAALVQAIIAAQAPAQAVPA